MDVRLASLVRKAVLVTVAALSFVSRPASVGAQTRTVPLSSLPTRNQGSHCLGQGERKLWLEHYMAGSINPLGIENQFRVTYCMPLIEKPGILFDTTNIETGLLNLISPTHVHLGGFLNVTPLAIFTFRTELTGFHIWPTPLQGAGFKTTNNAGDYSIEFLNRDGGSAWGVRLLFGGSLQGQVKFNKYVDVSFVDSFNGEFWRMYPSDPNPGEYYYLAKRDVMARVTGEWIFNNTAVLIFGFHPSPNHTIRIGVTDDLVHTPNIGLSEFTMTPTMDPIPRFSIPYPIDRGYYGNIAAGILAYSVKNLRNLARSFAMFIRVGTFTHHPYRTGITLAAGLDVYYELTKLKQKRPPDEAIQPPPLPPPAPESVPSGNETAAGAAPTSSPSPASDSTNPGSSAKSQ